MYRPTSGNAEEEQISVGNFWGRKKRKDRKQTVLLGARGRGRTENGGRKETSRTRGKATHLDGTHHETQ